MLHIVAQNSIAYDVKKVRTPKFATDWFYDVIVTLMASRTSRI
jgi:hypothetical protein